MNNDAQEKLSKESVGYSPGKEATHCGNCRHFIATVDHYGDSRCELVAGPIRWNFWCTRWERK